MSPRLVALGRESAYQSRRGHSATARRALTAYWYLLALETMLHVRKVTDLTWAQRARIAHVLLSDAFRSEVSTDDK
ncbi:hypothetical protein [Nocardia nova]|uniref:hypothetical protein n=1 Tax=Nocardia nova TaxID=37330 RepID=UPI00340A1892